MASDCTLSATSGKSTMARRQLCVLFALSAVPCAYALADASHRPVVIAAAPGETSGPQQFRINELQNELKDVQQRLKQRDLTASERKVYEQRRKSLQAELDGLVPKGKKPKTEKKTQTAKDKG